MAPNKTHIVRDPVPASHGRSFALCGLSGWLSTDSRTEFETAAGNIFESCGKREASATCKRCQKAALNTKGQIDE